MIETIKKEDVAVSKQDDYNKGVYLSSLLIPYEPDNDDITQYDVVSSDYRIYDRIEFIQRVGKRSFKEAYMNYINEIRSMDIKDQQLICELLIDKIQNIYKFEFIPNLIISTIEDINDFLLFVEFFEFEYIEFYVDLFKDIFGMTERGYIKNLLDVKEGGGKQFRLAVEGLIPKIDFTDLKKYNLHALFEDMIKTLDSKTLSRILLKIGNKYRAEIINLEMIRDHSNIRNDQSMVKEAQTFNVDKQAVDSNINKYNPINPSDMRGHQSMVKEAQTVNVDKQAVDSNVNKYNPVNPSDIRGYQPMVKEGQTISIKKQSVDLSINKSDIVNFSESYDGLVFQLKYGIQLYFTDQFMPNTVKQKIKHTLDTFHNGDINIDLDNYKTPVIVTSI